MSHHLGCARHRSGLPRRVPGPERWPPPLALPAHRRLLPHLPAGALLPASAVRGERGCAPRRAATGRIQPHQQLGRADPRLLLLGHPLRHGQAGGVPAGAARLAARRMQLLPRGPRHRRPARPPDQPRHPPRPRAAAHLRGGPPLEGWRDGPCGGGGGVPGPPHPGGGAAGGDLGNRARPRPQPPAAAPPGASPRPLRSPLDRPERQRPGDRRRHRRRGGGAAAAEVRRHPRASGRSGSGTAGRSRFRAPTGRPLARRP